MCSLPTQLWITGSRDNHPTLPQLGLCPIPPGLWRVSVAALKVMERGSDDGEARPGSPAMNGIEALCKKGELQGGLHCAPLILTSGLGARKVVCFSLSPDCQHLPRSPEGVLLTFLSSTLSTAPDA